MRSTDYIEIDALDSNSYECSNDPENLNRIKLVINNPVETNIFRIKTLVINPYVFKSSGYKVYYYEKKGDKEVG